MVKRVLTIDTVTGLKGHATFPSSGVPTEVISGATWQIPDKQQVFAILPIIFNGDVYLDGDLVIY